MSAIDFDRLRDKLAYQPISLGFVALIASAALAVAFDATKEHIAAAEQRDMQMSLSQVLPAGFADNDLLADVREQIREGKALSVAMESYPRDFTPVYLHMIRAGESSGALDQILFRLADFLEQQLALKHKVTNAALYPALMLAVGVAVLFFLMTFVVPKITAVFADLNQALPWPTLVLIGISGFLGTYWWLLLAGFAALVAGIRRVLRTPAGRATADRLLLKLPLLGNVARMVAVSRLASTLATMLASGVQLLEAMGVTKRVMNNTVLEQAVEKARENIREGESIAEPLRRSFSSGVTSSFHLRRRSEVAVATVHRLAVRERERVVVHVALETDRRAVRAAHAHDLR